MAATPSERLAARTLELIDVPSDSRDEAALVGYVLGALEAGGVTVRDAGDTCLLAGVLERGERPLVLLAGHLDTVPAQDNRLGRVEGDEVHGLGAADMKGSLAVMLELALVRAGGGAVDLGYVFFGREELPVAESALTPLLEREPALLAADLVLVMEPTAGAVQAGCLGNVNATWTFRGRSGHSARPWLADNAVHRAGEGIAALAARKPVAHEYEGLEFTEVVSVTRVAGGIAQNVVPDTATAHVNYRYPPGIAAADAQARLRAWCEPYGELCIDSDAPSAPVASGHPLVRSLVEAGNLAVEAKQAWTPIAEFAAHGLPAINLGPGDPALAHTREERVAIAALVGVYELLARWAA
ncbi:MAG TPA: succinyl-diaminopimelate desuccinylase [Solirubrobacteraceae bacterium]|nr:succinyl-diaminopimelate desuccinylase [Solirubrobacteraceae bacterium]